MRIAYGVMGYGRGHAMRSSALIQELAQHHSVRVYAGPDAHAVMAAHFDCVAIPCIHYYYGEEGRIDTWATIRRNIPPSLDLLFGGPQFQAMQADWEAFGPELVISDSEAWSHHLARKLRIPRISVDHVGVMAYCEPDFPTRDRALAQRDRLGYLAMMGLPQHALVSSFYPARPRYKNVTVVAPILRDIVHTATPHAGDHLLAYFNKGEYQFSDAVELALKNCGRPVMVYGSGRAGEDENLVYKAPSQRGFVDDMAGAAAVIATAGHQTASEALWLKKPMLLLPENAVEQRLNAHMVRTLGLGEQAELETLTGFDIQCFLRRLDGYRANTAYYRKDGRAETLAQLGCAIRQIKIGSGPDSIRAPLITQPQPEPQRQNRQ